MMNSNFPRLYQSGRWPAIMRGLISVIAVLILAAILFSQTAYAATGRQAVTHKVRFDQSDIAPLRTLDWRSPSATLTFDVPDNDWVDDVELLLSARPQGRVNTQSTLLVSFNDAAPIPLETSGQGFDARITLDRMRVRGQGNKVRLEYQVPAKDVCLSAGHGAWDLDVADSVIVVKSRSKLQALDFHDIRTRLSAQATQPKSIAIIAAGDDKVRLEALAAQGIARNLENIPQFRLGTTAADMVIIAAPRSQLKRWVSAAHLSENTGSHIAIAGTRPVKIILTGDTDAQVLAAAKAFSAANIPDSRAQALSPARYQRGTKHSGMPERLAGKALLSSIGAAEFSPGWAPQPQEMVFDVADPAASYGKLDLHLQTGTFVDESSRLDVTLNGQALKSISLSKSKSRTKLDIPKGMLRGLNNRLMLTPRLTPSSQQPVCASTRMGPGLRLGLKSSLTIRHDNLSPAADLSAFAASGAPFVSANITAHTADSEGSAPTVMLSTTSKAERAAALRVLAQLSRASHGGWTHARIVMAKNAVWPETGHVLMIGSQIDMAEAALSSAPRGLKVALSGARYQDPIVTKSATNFTDMPKLLTTRQSLSGGVAALYQNNNTQIIGIITQTRGESFTRAVDDLLEANHWNALEGSVARWNDTKVAMAQTAFVPKTISNKAPSSKSGFQLPALGLPQMSIGDKWTSFLRSVEKVWDKPEASPALPPSATRLGSHKITKRTSSIPSPRLKPTLANTPMMIGDRRVAVPGAPREDIFPKIDAWMSDAGTKITTGYAGLTQQLSGAVKATPIGERPANASASPKLLVFAIGIIFLLILAVFISPGKARPKGG